MQENQSQALWNRGRILRAKLILTVGYASGAMIVLGGGVMLLFFLTEQLFPLCTDQLNLSTVLKSLGVLLFSAVMAAEIGVSAVWIGYMKRSGTAGTGGAGCTEPV